MTRLDPIIAVKDIKTSSEWYQSVFMCHRSHGGDDFAVLKDEDGEILLCLHKWGEHEHPTMMDETIKPGNGLLLYFRTDKMHEILQNIKNLGHRIEDDLHTNPNSQHEEFSILDPDGYYLTITEFHKYEG